MNNKTVIHCRKWGGKMRRKGPISITSAAHGLAKDAVGKIRMAIVANLLRACLRVRGRVRDILESPPDGR